MIYSPIGKSFDLNPFYTGNIEVNLSNPSERCVGSIDIKFEPSGKFKINTKIPKNSVLAKQKLEPIKVKVSQGNILVNSFSKNIDITNLTVALSPFNLNLYIEEFEFEQNLDTEVKYWILPLTNFITDFRQYDPQLNYVSQTENINAKFYPHRLINFKFQNNQCWIEPLSDYEERKKKLSLGDIGCTITSIMVGEIDSMSIDSNYVKQNFPFDLLYVLGLATGTKVQAPWIEFRDANCQLIKRIHWNIQPIQYTKGHVVIKGNDIKQNSGIGHLLEKSLSSGILDKSHLKISLIYAILGGNINQYLEIRKGNFILALETLAKYYRCNSQNLTEGLENIQIHKINNYLNNAATQIKNLANPKSAVDCNQIEFINEISSRTKTTPIGKAKVFGLQVVQLLKHFKLLDYHVINNHYIHNPRSDGRDFAGVLSYYRGAIIHEGYFNFDSGDYDFEDVVRVLKHLHDILIRLNLIMLEYRGHYITPISNSPKRVHWVNVSTLASDLGYK